MRDYVAKLNKLLGVFKDRNMERFVPLVIIWSFALMCSTGHAVVISGIEFPPTLGGFELRSAIDNEKSNPGLGVTLLYNIPGVKASVFVYNHSQNNIPDGVDSPAIRKEFAESRNNVQRVYRDTQILVREERLIVEGIPVLHSELRYTEMNAGPGAIVLSHLYLTARKGHFIKVRATYSADDRPELARRIQAQFIESVCQVVAK